LGKASALDCAGFSAFFPAAFSAGFSAAFAGSVPSLEVVFLAGGALLAPSAAAPSLAGFLAPSLAVAFFAAAFSAAMRLASA